MDKLGPYDLNTIITGDARELAKAIPDESVDLIFTDPPYPREFLSLYSDLSRIAARVLKPGALCMALTPHMHLPEVILRLSEFLTYHWCFVMLQPGNLAPIHPRRIGGAGWKPVLSFSKGPYTGNYFPSDVLQSGERDKRFHSWGQHEQSACWVLLRTEARIILDPFTGGGTVPAVCKMLGRSYLAFEIDPTTADNARLRVQNTQPPLFVLQPEQLELSID